MMYYDKVQAVAKLSNASLNQRQLHTLLFKVVASVEF